MPGRGAAASCPPEDAGLQPAEPFIRAARRLFFRTSRKNCTYASYSAQVGNDRLRRFQNVKDAFEWHGPALCGEAMLVIDDVATTGATLEACASALRAAGSGPVTGVSVARVTV